MFTDMKFAENIAIVNPQGWGIDMIIFGFKGGVKFCWFAEYSHRYIGYQIKSLD